MKRTTLLFLFISCALIFSCNNKKDDPTPTDDPIPVNNKDTVGILGASSIKFLGMDSLNLDGDTVVFARFFDEKKNPQFVNAVSFYGINLDYNSLDQAYESYDIKDLPKSNWFVKGQGNIPDFNFNDTQKFPDYAGDKLLPDSIDISKNLTIQLSGIKDARYMTIDIYPEGKDEITSDILDASTSSVTFTPTELSKLQKGRGSVMINLTNMTLQIIDGKKFLFYNRTSFSKTIKIY